MNNCFEPFFASYLSLLHLFWLMKVNVLTILTNAKLSTLFVITVAITILFVAP